MCRSVPLVLVAAALAACATTSAVPDAAPARFETPTPRSTYQITTGELQMARSAISTLSALERLRPGFRTTLGGRATLLERLPAPVVFINGAYAGPLEVLQTLPVDVVNDIRLLRPMDAVQRYGTHLGGGGVVLVTLRRAP
ncbi:MAG TPA: hypothetical protein VFS08_12060 [Gemmatimonadaceae bacterium]|nr:hypothetical protein [Gemmatimonadaceae bacterium]